MTTNAFPLKKRPYIFATKPTASAPTAAEMSLWFLKRVPVKWLVTQPMHEMATRRYCSESRQLLHLENSKRTIYSQVPAAAKGRGCEDSGTESRQVP